MSDRNDDDMVDMDGVENAKREPVHNASTDVRRYDQTRFRKSKNRKSAVDTKYR